MNDRLGGPTESTVSVIVVNWNQAEYLKRCLRSLEAGSPPGTEIIVVDNASNDGSPAIAAELFPALRLVQSDRNLGWVGGVHEGVRHSNGQILLLLNNDTEIAPGCIEAILKEFERRPEVAVVGCRVRDLQHRQVDREAGMSIDRFGFMIPFENRRPNLPPFYVSGTGLAVRRAAVEELGLFDERYEVYAEDIDLCWRYRLAGRDVAVANDAVLYHEIGATVPGGIKGSSSRYESSMRRVYLRERNALATMLKNYSLGSLLYVLPTYFLLLLGEVLLSIAMLQPSWGGQCVRAVVWNVRNIVRTLELRASVQAKRQVRDRELPFDPRLGKFLAFRVVGIPKVIPGWRRTQGLQDKNG
jgi:GT2 family glycosyltransferase